MKSIWMGIAPNSRSTRIVAMTGPKNTILKAQLATEPKHHRALTTLLEAIALWQGQPVRAALCVDAEARSFDSSLYREAFADEGGALYSIVWTHATERRRRLPYLSGMGEFADLEQMVVEEVAR